MKHNVRLIAAIKKNVDVPNFLKLDTLSQASFSWMKTPNAGFIKRLRGGGIVKPAGRCLSRSRENGYYYHSTLWRAGPEFKWVKSKLMEAEDV